MSGKIAANPFRPVASKIIPDDPCIGLLIGTFGATPYIHLFLESARRNFPNVPIVVHDDCSPDFERLALVTRRYDARLIVSPVRLGHYQGDIAAVLASILWGKTQGWDIVIKMSRRFIPLVDWTARFKHLSVSSQYATYCNECEDTNIGFRAECIGMHVNSWCGLRYIERLRYGIRTGDIGLVEAFIHDVAREIQRNACLCNQKYEHLYPRPQRANAYGVWDLMGSSRGKKTLGVLWHHSSGPGEYLAKAIEYDLPYTLIDFENV